MMNRRRFFASVAALGLFPAVKSFALKELPFRFDIKVCDPISGEWVLFPAGMRGLKRGMIFVMTWPDHFWTYEMGTREWIGGMHSPMGVEDESAKNLCYACAATDGRPITDFSGVAGEPHPRAGECDAEWFATYLEAYEAAAEMKREDEYNALIASGKTYSFKDVDGFVSAQVYPMQCSGLRGITVFPHGAPAGSDMV